MHKRRWLVPWIGLLLLACVVAVPPPPPTSAPTLAVATPTPGANAAATPTMVPTRTPVARRAAPTPFWDWTDLAPHRKAMRPEFVMDVDTFADATRYAIEVTVDVEAHAFRGTEWVLYVNHELEPLTEIVFRLLPNTPGYGGTLDLSTITVNGVTADTYRQFADSALYVLLPVPLLPAETVELGLTFEGTLPTDGSAGYAQYGYIDGVLALPNFYPMIPVYDDEG